MDEDRLLEKVFRSDIKVLMGARSFVVREKESSTVCRKKGKVKGMKTMHG